MTLPAPWAVSAGRARPCRGKPIYRLTPDQHAAALARGARPVTSREFLTLLA